MGIMDWLQKKSQEKSASNILDGLQGVVAAVRADVQRGMGQAERLASQAAVIEKGGELSDAHALGDLQALQQWRGRKAKVVEAQKKLLEDLALWSSLPPERSLNEVILPALLSGRLVASSEPCFGPVVVAVYRVCEAAARQKGVDLPASTPPEVLDIVKDAGDLYK